MSKREQQDAPTEEGVTIHDAYRALDQYLMEDADTCDVEAGLDHLMARIDRHNTGQKPGRGGFQLAESGAVLLGLLHDGPATSGQLVATAKERLGTRFSVTRTQ